MSLSSNQASILGFTAHKRSRPQSQAIDVEAAEMVAHEPPAKRAATAGSGSIDLTEASTSPLVVPFKVVTPPQRDRTPVSVYYAESIYYPGGGTSDSGDWRETGHVRCTRCGKHVALGKDASSGKSGKPSIHWQPLLKHMALHHFDLTAPDDRHFASATVKELERTVVAHNKRSASGEHGTTTTVQTSNKHVDAFAELITHVPTLAIRLVENKAFRTYVKAIHGDSEFPDHKGVMAALQRRYDAEKVVTRAMIAGMQQPIGGSSVVTGALKRRLSVSTDCWTDTSQRGYLALIIHGYNAVSKRLEKRELGVVYFKPPHTAERVLAQMEKMLAEFDLTFNDVSATTADGGSNIRANASAIAARFPHHFLLYCFHHRLNLASKAAGAVVEDDESFTALKDLMTTIHRSPKKQDALDDARLGLAAASGGIASHRSLRPTLTVSTRYNTYLFLLRRALTLWPGVTAMPFATLGFKNQWEKDFELTRVGRMQHALHVVVDVMTAVEKATLRLSTTAKVTLSLVPQAVSEMLAVARASVVVLDAGSEVAVLNGTLINNYCNTLIQQLTTRYGTTRAHLPLLEVVAEHLDIRTAVPLTRQFIADRYGYSYVQTERGDLVNTIHGWYDRDRPIVIAASIPTHDPFNLLLTPALAGAPVAAPEVDVSEQRKVAILQEVSSLIKATIRIATAMPPADVGHVDSLSFWDQLSGRMPILAHYALTVLAIPAAEAECERLFSLAGTFLSESRSRMLPANANMLCMLNRWTQPKPPQDTKAAQISSEATSMAVAVALSAIDAPMPLLTDITPAVDAQPPVDAEASALTEVEAVLDTRCALEAALLERADGTELDVDSIEEHTSQLAFHVVGL